MHLLVLDCSECVEVGLVFCQYHLINIFPFGNLGVAFLGAIRRFRLISRPMLHFDGVGWGVRFFWVFFPLGGIDVDVAVTEEDEVFVLVLKRLEGVTELRVVIVGGSVVSEVDVDYSGISCVIVK